MSSPLCLAVSLFLSLLVSVDPGGDSRDEIVLKNGKKLRGRIVAETDDRIQLQIGTVKRWYKKSSIESFDSVTSKLQEVLATYHQLETETSEKLLELAELCAKNRLPHEEKLFYWRIVASDPKHELANERLRHRQKDNGWLARVKKSWVPVEKLDKAHRDFSKAWRLRTEHFDVRSNTSLKQVLDTLLDLEFFYLYFYRLFGNDLALPELTEPVQVYLYKKQEEFPSQGTHAGAYFDEKERVLYTYMTNEGRPYQLFRVATQGFLHMLIERAAGSKGSFPVWLKEAFADHMAAIVIPRNPSRPDLEPDRRSEPLLNAVARTHDPFSITRILNFEEADYLASSKQDLKYGQGYALFHYLLYGPDKLKEKFLLYLREAVSAQGQSSTFNRIFKPNLKAIEVRHILHARQS